MTQINDIQTLDLLRHTRWGQTTAARIAGPEQGLELIERVGVATLFPASPEVPNLFHAYVGDPTAKTDSAWDSPAGQIYSWRWALGQSAAAFYTTIVRSRPTWVSWAMLPTVLRLCGVLRSPDELYHAGQLSADAYRIAQALEDAPEAVSTGDLRQAAGFPIGKPQRAAYLKAVEELETRLLLAKVFSPTDQDMRHALVERQYPAYVEAAERLTQAEALHNFLTAYLSHAIYVVPGVLARHLKWSRDELEQGLDRLGEQVEPVKLPGIKGGCYIWRDAL